MSVNHTIDLKKNNKNEKASAEINRIYMSSSSLENSSHDHVDGDHIRGIEWLKLDDCNIQMFFRQPCMYQ